MDPATLTLVVTTVGPWLVAGIKKLAKTRDIEDEATQRVVHSTLPIAVGLAASILNCMVGACDPSLAGGCPEQISWSQCILHGLAAGAGASYMRDLDKNVLGAGSAIAQLVKKKPQ